MKYVSLDVETTGIHKSSQVVEIGAVLRELWDDKHPSECPSIDLLIHNPKGYIASPRIMQMHKQIFDDLGEYEEVLSNGMIPDDVYALEEKKGVKFVTEDEAIGVLSDFLEEHGYINKGGRFNVLGKNFMSFDDFFLRKLKGWRQKIYPRGRAMDPAQFFIEKGDTELPSFGKCKERSGIDMSEGYSHRAVQDAIETILLFEEGMRRLHTNKVSP